MRCLIGKKYDLLLGQVLEEHDTYFVVSRSFFLGEKKDKPTTSVVPKSWDSRIVELTQEEFDKEAQKVYNAFNEAHKERLQNESN